MGSFLLETLSWCYRLLSLLHCSPRSENLIIYNKTHTYQEWPREFSLSWQLQFSYKSLNWILDKIPYLETFSFCFVIYELPKDNFLICIFCLIYYLHYWLMHFTDVRVWLILFYFTNTYLCALSHVSTKSP